MTNIIKHTIFLMVREGSNTAKETKKVDHQEITSEDKYKFAHPTTKTNMYSENKSNTRSLSML
jgi:hypothetical protein